MGKTHVSDFYRRVLCTLLVLLILTPYGAGGALCSEAGGAPDQAARQLTLTFLGDCTLGSTPLTRADKTSFISYIERCGLDYPFSGVIDILKNDDLTVANLESVFYDYEANRADKTYNFRAETAWARMLPLASIDLVSLGNNHIGDYGEKGYLSTIAALEANGVPYFGTNDYADIAYVYESGDIRIGFLAVYVTYWWLNNQVFIDALKRLEDMDLDLTIVCMHAGVEYDKRHDVSQERMMNTFFKYGADIIVGHHPHVIQGIVRRDGKSCLYSLGNFSFGGNKALKSDACYMAQITLSFDETGVYLGHQINIIPCSPSSNGEYNDYRPVPVTGRAAERVMEKIQYDTAFKLNPYVEGIGAIQDFIPAQTLVPDGANGV